MALAPLSIHHGDVTIHQEKQGAQAPCFCLSPVTNALVFHAIPDSAPMSSSPLRTVTLAFGLLIAASLALSGCGRKGDLDAPSTPVEKLNKRNYKPADKAPERPFILDPLL